MVKCVRGTVLRTPGHVPHGEAQSKPHGVSCRSAGPLDVCKPKRHRVVHPIFHSHYMTLRKRTHLKKQNKAFNVETDCLIYECNFRILEGEQNICNLIESRSPALPP